MNIKRKYKITAMLLAFILIFSATLALFADRASTEAEGTAGSVQLSDINLSGKLLDENGKNILNPGDMRDLSFTVTNEGNMSVDVRETIILQAFNDEGAQILFSNDGQSEFELYHRSDVEANQYGSYSPKSGATPLTRKVLAGNKITYSPVRYILNGNESQNPREIEPGINSSSRTNDYVLVYKGETSNDWQGSELYVSVLVEAIQHRNTQSADEKWNLISRKTISFGNQNIDVVPQILRNYTITYNLNGGTLSAVNPSTYNNESGIITLNNPSKANAIFTGWTWDGQPTPEKNVSFNTESFSGNIAFTANYLPFYSLDTGANVKTKLGTSTTKVIFGLDSDYPDIVDSVTPVQIGATSGDKIYLYSVGNEKYILSDGVISFNPISSTMFMGFSNLTSITFNNIDTSKVTNMMNMFNGCSRLTTLDVSGFDTSKVTNMQAIFSGCSSLISLDLSAWDTSNVKTDVTDYYGIKRYSGGMANMFYNCSNVQSINLSSFNTENIIIMSYMFYNCTNLKALDVSGFDTRNVTESRYMFYGCNQLTTIDTSSWNTSNITNMTSMFENCGKLTTIDTSTWDTSKATLMSSMFEDCSSLTTIDLSSWNTSKVTDMTSMFYGCSAITSLDLSSWNTIKTTKTLRMFSDCTNLRTIYVGTSWNTSSVTSHSDMFYRCTSIVGGAGTRYNSSYTDKTYARVDNPTNGSPGYLTLK